MFDEEEEEVVETSLVASAVLTSPKMTCAPWVERSWTVERPMPVAPPERVGC